VGRTITAALEAAPEEAELLLLAASSADLLHIILNRASKISLPTNFSKVFLNRSGLIVIRAIPTSHR